MVKARLENTSQSDLCGFYESPYMGNLLPLVLYLHPTTHRLKAATEVAQFT